MSEQYPRPSVTVDLVVFTVFDSDLKVLLIERGEEPFAGSWALPGGFVRVENTPDSRGEGLDAAAYRELQEETGLTPSQVHLEQLCAFGRPFRDPRFRVSTIAYPALVQPHLALTAGTDAADARWFSVRQEVPEMSLAFDHAQILAAALSRVQEQIEARPIAFRLVGPTFSKSELRAVYETLRGVPYDPSNFARRFTRWEREGMIEKAPGKRITGARRAQVYRFRTA